MSYRKMNNIIGWIVFLIAATVYILTLEPTTSLWDCGEYIATAYKLQVGHPPGAPFFQLIARFFSLFAGGDVTKVAYMVNLMSGLASGFTIMFLFWTITYFAKKIIGKGKELLSSDKIAIFASGVVGALAYTFTDSFWFSAVEGEVYALSSFFTAATFWLILKWESQADEKYSSKWLLLIAYLIGMSIGVHLLNLLAIPAVVFVFYFKKYKPTRNGMIFSGVLSVVILAIIMYFIIPGVVSLSGKMELFFVNSLGLPFNSGTIFFFIIMITGIVWGLRYSIKNKKTILNISLLSFVFLLIGYSSFILLVIRSNADTPIDENNPENAVSLLSYLNREQYGSSPLIKGQFYNTPVVKMKDGSPVYERDYKKGKYVVIDDKKGTIPVYDSKTSTIFPRMYSSQNSPGQSHLEGYKRWGGITGKQVTTKDGNGRQQTLVIPTFGENLTFFFRYQIGHMYLRYFMWNFAGRQNDIQGHGGITHGNWISGIPFIDNNRLGDQSQLPNELKTNRANNKYYFLPLLLGLIGLFYQYKKDPKNVLVILLLFFFTGMAISIFLNMPPFQPRERDYAFVGSFYAFAIWIGLGVLGVHSFLSKRKVPAKVSAIAAGVVTLLLVPVIMANQNWDDHDRSERYTARAFARNYLESCAPNAILFSVGDNDTFPLWYAQEVEGIRTDIKIVNLSLLNMEWYVEQMRRQVYDSKPVPMTLTRDKYLKSGSSIVYLTERNKEVDVKQAIAFVKSNNPQTKLQKYDYIPSKNFVMKVDSAKVIANGTVSPESANKILKQIKWNINKTYLTTSDLIMLDIISTNDWDRPIYFTSAGYDGTLGLRDHFQVDGFTYRLVPIKTKSNYAETGRVETDVLYNNLMNKFKWGNINGDIHLDEFHKRTIRVVRIRSKFSRLAKALKIKGENEKAILVLNKCMELLPHRTLSYTPEMLSIIDLYYTLNKTESANNIITEYKDDVLSDLNYYMMLEKEGFPSDKTELKRDMAILQELGRIAKTNKQDSIFQDISDKTMELVSKYK